MHFLHENGYYISLCSGSGSGSGLIRIRIRIHMFLGLPDPDRIHLVRCMDLRMYGSRTESGSTSQRHGSADPDSDPHQNVMDPEHWYFRCCLWFSNIFEYNTKRIDQGTGYGLYLQNNWDKNPIFKHFFECLYFQRYFLTIQWGGLEYCLLIRSVPDKLERRPFSSHFKETTKQDEQKTTKAFSRFLKYDLERSKSL